MINFYGLLTGIVFGFILQRAQVLRYDKQVGALLLEDFTIVAFMLSHIAVAMVGIYLLHGLGVVELSVKATAVGQNIVGGLLFGIGWGLAGYCPGTSIGAMGEGRFDAFWPALGMLVGAGLYAHVYEGITSIFGEAGKLGKITLPEVFGTSPWIVIFVLLIVYGVILLLVGKHLKSRAAN